MLAIGYHLSTRESTNLFAIHTISAILNTIHNTIATTNELLIDFKHRFIPTTTTTTIIVNEHFGHKLQYIIYNTIDTYK